MLVRASISDVTATAAVTGVMCSGLNESLSEVGFGETELAASGRVDFSDSHGDNKPWKNIFGAGQGVGRIERISPTLEIAYAIVAECHAVR